MEHITTNLASPFNFLLRFFNRVKFLLLFFFFFFLLFAGYIVAGTLLLFAIVILGGAGNIWGVLLGAALVVGLPELFRDLKSARMLFFGGAMVLMMVFRPQGLLPPPRSRYNAARWLGLFPCAVGSTPVQDGQEHTDAPATPLVRESAP